MSRAAEQEPPYFARARRASEGGRDGLLTGVLTRTGQCLEVVSGQARFLVIWPPTATYRVSADGGIAVTDGARTIRTGERVEVVGGAPWEPRLYPDVVELPIPETCNAPAWRADSFRSAP
jgi:hypothetical protein